MARQNHSSPYLVSPLPTSFTTASLCPYGFRAYNHGIRPKKYYSQMMTRPVSRETTRIPSLARWLASTINKHLITSRILTSICPIKLLGLSWTTVMLPLHCHWKKHHTCKFSFQSFASYPSLTQIDYSDSASLPELNDDELEEAFSEDAERIAATLSECGKAAPLISLPPIINDYAINPFNSVDPSSIDLSTLSALRFSHQTKQAETGVRTSQSRSTSVENGATSSPAKALTDRQRILRGFAEIIRECGDRGIGTGLERSVRWRNPAPGGRNGQIEGEPTPVLAAGNSMNAVVTADAIAKKVRLLTSLFIHYLTCLSTGFNSS